MGPGINLPLSLYLDRGPLCPIVLTHDPLQAEPTSRVLVLTHALVMAVQWSPELAFLTRTWSSFSSTLPVSALFLSFSLLPDSQIDEFEKYLVMI